MLVYQRRVKVNGFHTIETKGIGAEIQYSFRIYIEDEWRQESITEWFTNVGDAPHIGEVITIEVIVSESEGWGVHWRLDMIGW